MPKVSLEKWAKCVENILQNKQYYFDAIAGKMDQIYYEAKRCH